MKGLLFIIDMQNDFCSPTGSLYVPDAEIDAARLVGFIRRNTESIDEILLTQDNHQVMDIAHPAFWINERGEHPVPYTVISWKDVDMGKWKPVLCEMEASAYLQKLESNDEYEHTIWPEHCIWGSEGAAIYPELMDAVEDWAREGKMFEVISKGMYPLTEHFGAFRANVPVDDVPETLFNYSLLEKMRSFDRIWIAGEAKSHCVANTIKQLFDYPELFPKMVLLEDCMGNVNGFESLALPIYEEAERFGAVFSHSRTPNP
jgi:nicotinamidase-related amidase